VLTAYSADRVRAAEAVLMATVPEGELMRRAALGLAQVCRARLAECRGSSVVALVGPGNNGGDALYAVAQLAEDGFDCVVLHGDWEVHQGGLGAARAAGVRVLDPSGDWSSDLGSADLVVDGLLGIGGRPGLPAQAVAWVDAIPESAYVLAVDLPSGHDPGGERASETGVFADETVTFGVAKPVHLLPATEVAVGRLTVVDIGLWVDGPAEVERLDHDDVSVWWPVPGALDDKYSRGVLGVIAGSEGYPGAAVLCCTAAVGAGPGMLRYIGPPTAVSLVRAAVPEAVVGPGRVQAYVVGPGLDATSSAPDVRSQLDAAREALATDLPVLVDAGGLDLVEGARPAPTLLTPHAGELARLLTRLTGSQVDRTQVSRAPLASVREAADRTGATVLLKGATTLVVPPTSSGLPVRSQNDAPPWLATAGAGDVLAGVCGVLLAAGLSPLDAGSLGALVHGVAADRANPGGPLRALAVAHGIPSTVAHLLTR
jgi:hydroxyethylthiazole kinase-like uncharacterized protein yjeF